MFFRRRRTLVTVIILLLAIPGRIRAAVSKPVVFPLRQKSRWRVGVSEARGKGW